ncbi:MAG: hypothetical protein RLZZ163_1456, partial [Actinomycetota bacterium]
NPTFRIRAHIEDPAGNLLLARVGAGDPPAVEVLGFDRHSKKWSLPPLT